MGFAFTCMATGETYELNFGMWRHIEEALVKAGIFCYETDLNSRFPKWNPPEDDTEYEEYSVEYDDKAYAVRTACSDFDSEKVPAAKFSNNSGWILSEKECEIIYGGMLKGASEVLLDKPYIKEFLKFVSHSSKNEGFEVT